MMSEIQAYVKVYGMVQGVGFRYFTRHVGNSLGVSGFVRNLPDGGVEAVIEGEENKVRQMIDRLREGPDSSIVEDLQVEIGEYSGQFRGFTIRF
jgi:acylphosphatase